MKVDAIIIGGGIAGLQAAIQLGRYRHNVLVIDAGYGRSTLCRSYHNVLGYPQGIAGNELRRLGKMHAESAGVKFLQDEVVKAGKSEEGFKVECKHRPGETFHSRTVLLATGVMDRFPPLPGLLPCLGMSVFICPDCDGYEVQGRRTIVMGSGESGANMALVLKYWTDDVVYVNHEQKEIGVELERKLREAFIPYISEKIVRVISENEVEFQGVELVGGEVLTASRAFIAFGGNEVKTAIALQLGVERMENGHIATDPRTKQTTIPNVWAAGDIAVHAEQVTVAMGDGSLAAIWMHKALMEMKSRKREPEKEQLF